MAFQALTPYITPIELQKGETGIDWSSLPAKGADPLAQAAEQLSVCWRVTERMDAICEQVLRAQVVTETLRGPDYYLTMDRDTGEGIFRAARWPVLGILSGQWSHSATFPPQWTQIPINQFLLDQTNGYLGGLPAGVDDTANVINFAPGNLDWSMGRNGFRCQIQYVAGWPNCGLTAVTASPWNSLQVDDISGWDQIPNLAGRIYDGDSSESFIVSSVTPGNAPNSGPHSGPGTLVLAQAIGTNPHGVGTRVSAMPSNMQQAAYALATAFARMRGATAFAVPTRGGSPAPASKSIEDLIVEAEEILSRYVGWL